MGQPVVHWEIAGKDAAKLQEFYSGIFDWKVNVDEALITASSKHEGKAGSTAAYSLHPTAPPLTPCFMSMSTTSSSISTRSNHSAEKR